MLEFQLTDDTPLIREGITCYRCDSSVQVGESEETVSHCFCEFECEEPLIQFASDKEREKDYFLLYYESSDEDLETIYKINETTLEDGTHGEAIEDGFLVDFTKIYNTLGGGIYTLTMEVTEWGVEFEKKYGKFKVAPFNIKRADGTVKIEAIQNGEIEKSFNFKGNNVPFSLRIPGILTDKTYVYELLDTPDNKRRDRQIHDRFWNEYNLIFNLNKYNFAELIFENMLIGSELYISDYSLENQHRENPFNRIPLRLVETESEHIKKTNTTQYTVKLKDAIRDGVKHPYIKK